MIGWRLLSANGNNKQYTMDHCFFAKVVDEGPSQGFSLPKSSKSYFGIVIHFRESDALLFVFLKGDIQAGDVVNIDDQGYRPLTADEFQRAFGDQATTVIKAPDIRLEVEQHGKGQGIVLVDYDDGRSHSSARVPLQSCLRQ